MDIITNDQIENFYCLKKMIYCFDNGENICFTELFDIEKDLTNMLNQFSNYIDSIDYSELTNENFVIPSLVLNGTIQQTLGYLLMINLVTNKNILSSDLFNLIKKNIFGLETFIEKLNYYYPKSLQENKISEDLQILFTLYNTFNINNKFNIDNTFDVDKELSEIHQNIQISADNINIPNENTDADIISIPETSSICSETAHNELINSESVEDKNLIFLNKIKSYIFANKYDINLEHNKNFYTNAIFCTEIINDDNKELLGYIFFSIKSDNINIIDYEITYKTPYCLPMTLIKLPSDEVYDIEFLKSDIIDIINSVIAEMIQ